VGSAEHGVPMGEWATRRARRVRKGRKGMKGVKGVKGENGEKGMEGLGDPRKCVRKQKTMENPLTLAR